MRLVLPLVSPFVLLPGACGGRAAFERESQLHLEEQVDGASVTSAEAPAAAKEQKVWRFDEPRPDWRVVSSSEVPWFAAVTLEPLADGVRLSLARPEVQQGPFLIGGLAVDLEESRLDEWSAVVIRARSRERLAGLTIATDVDEERNLPDPFVFFDATDEAAPVFSDGSEQAYSIPLRAAGGSALHEGAFRSLGVFAGAPAPASFELLSVTLVPRGAGFLEDLGVRAVTRESVTRRALFAHAPAALKYRAVLPAGARLDFGLTSLPGDPIAYRVSARADGGTPEVLLDEEVDEPERWLQRSIDLARFAGGNVELVLEASSAREGAVALWGAPVLSGTHPSRLPNVIFYVIDGGGADLMSLYGYNRCTTPFLEQLAGEGAVFERAFSNSTWTQSSTASFMTSLQHSVLGGLRRGIHSTPVPHAATTMAEHLHRGGYATAVFTSNPNAARLIGLERGVDVMRDTESGNHSTSSAELHERFWQFRRDYPGSPYWVHFQTTDVHEPNHPEAPFSGLFVSAEESARLEEWDNQLYMTAGDLFGTTSIAGFYDAALERAGIDRQAYFNIRRGLYDETMAHQDHELRRFVERLKAAGEWDNTLFIITADHGHPAGTFARFGRGLFDPQPAPWQGALFDSYATHVPLVFVWPGHIAGGQRFEAPVSLIDVLPTVLELAGLPPAEIAQGRSLAPLLRGKEVDLLPVILDEFRVDEKSGEMIGNLEIVDGRWGASLEIGPVPDGADPARGRHAVPAGGRWGAVHPFFPEAPRLLLYDLWNDPFAVRAVNDEHPDLVERYRDVLMRQWEAQRSLAQRFQEAGEAALSPEQLQQLQALGYIR